MSFHCRLLLGRMMARLSKICPLPKARKSSSPSRGTTGILIAFAFLNSFNTNCYLETRRPLVKMPTYSTPIDGSVKQRRRGQHLVYMGTCTSSSHSIVYLRRKLLTLAYKTHLRRRCPDLHRLAICSLWSPRLDRGNRQQLRDLCDSSNRPSSQRGMPCYASYARRRATEGRKPAASH